MTFRKYLVLAGVVFFSSVGDPLLSYGMKQVGPVNLSHPLSVVLAVLNPWVTIGIIFLLAFMACYLSALSWADLTYVLPATSIGYVLMVLIAKFVLHEHVSLLRWLGVILIAAGVGFVTQGPELTPARKSQTEAAVAVSSSSAVEP
ncbi:MAG TPA: EamA family transporter [Terriglobales bacterium]